MSQTIVASGSAAGLSVGPLAGVQAGDLIGLVANVTASATDTVATVSDNVGGVTYTRVLRNQGSSLACAIEVWWGVAASAGTYTITVTGPVATTTFILSAIVVRSTLGVTWAVDASAVLSDAVSQTTHACAPAGELDTTIAEAALLGGGALTGSGGGTPTVATGFTSFSAPSGTTRALAQYKLATATETDQRAIWTSSSARPSNNALVAFTATTVVSAPTTRLSQAAVEVVAGIAPPARISQASVEVLSALPAPLRLSQAIVELLYPTDPCAGLGRVLPGIDPAEAPSLSTATVPIAWLEVTLGGTVHRWAAVSVPHGLPKAGRVIHMGRLMRRLTDGDGGPQAATVTTVLADTDRVLRTTAFAGALQHALAEYYVADLATIRAGGLPTRVFRGRVQSWSADANLTFTVTVEDELTARLTSADAIDRQVPIRLIDATVHDATPIDRSKFQAPAPEIYGRLNDRRLNSTWQDGTWECPHIATIDGDLAMFLVCAQPIKHIEQVYVANTAGTDREPLLLYSDLWLPHSPGWPLIHPWFETVSGRWTVMFATRGVPVYELAVEKRVPLVIDLCAYEDIGDTTGAMIESPAWAFLHWFNNRLMEDVTGDWAPLFALGDYSLFDWPAWQRVHALCQDRGYRVAGVLGHDYELVSWRDRVAEWCHNFGLDIGTNRHGQVLCLLLDRNQVHADAPLFTPAQILERGCTVQMLADAVENIVPYVYRRNYLSALQGPTPAEGQITWREPFNDVWLAAEESLEDEASITALGGRPRGIRRARRQEYTLIREGQVATYVAGERLALHAPPNGRALVTFDLLLRDGWALELGDIIRLDHWDLPWSGPRRCQVRSVDVDLDMMTMMVTARDVDDLLGALP